MIIKDIKALFSKLRLNQKDADEILIEISSGLKISNVIDEVIESLIEDVYTKGRKNIVLRAIKNDLVEKSIEDIFLKYGLIDSKEYLYFLNTNSIGNSISQTLNSRKKQGYFEKILRIIFLPFALKILVGFIAFKYVTIYANKFFNEEMLKIIKKLKPYYTEANFPSYFTNQYLLDLALFGYIALVMILVFMYLYLYKNNVKIIYKIFSIKMLDDLQNQLIYMKNLRDNGADEFSVYENLSDNTYPKSLRLMYKELTTTNKDSFFIFQKYNFDKNFVTSFRRLDKNGILWENLSSIDTDNGFIEQRGLLPSIVDKLNNKFENFLKYSIGIFSFLGTLIMFCLGFAPVLVLILIMLEAFL